MNRAQLDEFVSTVNERVQECIESTEYDRVFLDSLAECGIDECELGSAFMTDMGDWFWAFRADGVVSNLIQYGSGRVALIQKGGGR